MQNLRIGARIGAGGVLVLALLLTACGRLVSSGPGEAAARPAQAATTPASVSTPALGTPVPGFPGFFPARPSPPAPPASGPPIQGAAGTPPDPYSLLDPLTFVAGPSQGVLVKEDLLNLDSGEPKNALLTLSAAASISGTNRLPFASLPYSETRSALAVVAFDTVSQTWKIRFHLPDPGVPGRAEPLPSAVQGQNLLRTDPPTPILQLRTETTPTIAGNLPTIALHLYAWKDGTARPLPMRPAGATTDQDAIFSGSGGVQLIDIDDDGRAEVVVDDAAKTTIWKWDGTRFVPR